MKLDSSLLIYLNTLYATSTFWHHVFPVLAFNRFVRGAPIFASLVYVCFKYSSAKQKSRLTLEFIGVLVALTLSLMAQNYLPTHVRPIFNDSLNLLGTDSLSAAGWGSRPYSMPSDTATVFFAIGVMVFIENKRLGALCLVWGLLTAGAGRVATAIHYPSDILTALILGGAIIYACSRLYFIQNFIEKAILRFDPQFIAFNIGLFLFCAEAYSLFPGLQPLEHFVLKVLSGRHIDWLY
jgi:membrane-associated phospholipid phosphatase